jgi:hypothetical protein
VSQHVEFSILKLKGTVFFRVSTKFSPFLRWGGLLMLASVGLSAYRVLVWWVCLLLSGLVFLPLLKEEGAQLQFFFFQEVATFALVFCLLQGNHFGGLVSLSLKIALPPIHYWVVSPLKKGGFEALLRFLTALKLLPIWMIISFSPFYFGALAGRILSRLLTWGASTPLLIVFFRSSSYSWLLAFMGWRRSIIGYCFFVLYSIGLLGGIVGVDVKEEGKLSLPFLLTLISVPPTLFFLVK